MEEKYWLQEQKSRNYKHELKLSSVKHIPMHAVCVLCTTLNVWKWPT